MSAKSFITLSILTLVVIICTPLFLIACSSAPEDVIVEMSTERIYPSEIRMNCYEISEIISNEQSLIEYSDETSETTGDTFEESDVVEESEIEISFEISTPEIIVTEISSEDVSEESNEEYSIDVTEHPTDIHLTQYNSSSEITFKDINVYDKNKQIVSSLRVFIYGYEYRYNYLNTVYNCFMRHKKDYSIPCAAVLAQAYNEGGGGRTGTYLGSNNCFGIKATGSWEGKVYSQISYNGDGLVYMSYADAIHAGVPKLSLYRVYNNIDESVEDYINFITDNYSDSLWKNSLPCTKQELYSNAFKFNYYNYSEEIIRNSYLGSILWDGYGEKFALNEYAHIIRKFHLFEPSLLKNRIKE